MKTVKAWCLIRETDGELITRWISPDLNEIEEVCKMFTETGSYTVVPVEIREIPDES